MGFCKIPWIYKNYKNLELKSLGSYLTWCRKVFSQVWVQNRKSKLERSIKILNKLSSKRTPLGENSEYEWKLSVVTNQIWPWKHSPDNESKDSLSAEWFMQDRSGNSCYHGDWKFSCDHTGIKNSLAWWVIVWHSFKEKDSYGNVLK